MEGTIKNMKSKQLDLGKESKDINATKAESQMEDKNPITTGKKHKDIKKSQYKCALCKDSFTPKEKLENHITEHKKKLMG